MKNKEDKRLKVLFLARWYPVNQEEIGIFIQKHAKAVARYCDVAVLYVSSGVNLNNTFESSVSTVNSFPEIVVRFKKNEFVFINAINYLRASWLGFKIAKQHLKGIDFNHVHVLNRPGVFALLIKKTIGIPYLITEHWTGYSSGEYAKGNFFKRKLTSLIVKNSVAVTTVSDSLKNTMQSLGLKNNYRVIPNVIDAVSLPESKKSEKVKILTVADLVDARKNVSAVIKAMAEITKEQTQIEYHIIGSGPDEDKLKNLADSLNLTNKFVFFHGKQTNASVYRFLSEIDFVIINSNVETFSVVAAEALVSGKPVIATRCGGPEEFVNESNGIRIEPNNQKQLEEAILDMLNSYKNYEPRVLCESIMNRFGYGNVGKQFYDLYRELSL